MSDSNSGFPQNPNPTEPTTAQPPLILPAPQEQQPYYQAPQQSPSGRWIPPQGVGSRPLPINPMARPTQSWKNDPAYRVLFIAIGVVLLSSLICVVVLAATFSQPSTQSTGPNNHQSANIKTNSPTPTATPTPSPTPTATSIPEPTPTPAPIVPAFAIQVDNTVQNGQSVSVSIIGSQPGASVHLSITYNNAKSFSTTNQPQNADATGTATITWNVLVIPVHASNPVTAVLKATGQDQQGVQTTSDAVTVQINIKGQQ